MSQLYTVLFFVRGMVPTQEQRDEANTYGPNCSFRNLLYVSDEATLEECVAVAGEVPARYAAAYPQAVPISDWYAGKLGPSPKALVEPVDDGFFDGSVAPPPMPDEATGEAPAAPVPGPKKPGSRMKIAPEWSPQG